MEPFEQKRISSDFVPNNDEKPRITGDNTSPDGATIPSDGPTDPDNNNGTTTNNVDSATNNTPEAITDQDLLAKATHEGGLTQIPTDFEQKMGSWRFILSNNPFEVLYIDYKQRSMVTPQMVENNYALLSTFWQDKLLLMSRGATEKLKARYGEETINTAQKKLDTAYDKIKTPEGINNYFKELEGQRISAGIASIASLINFMLADGELTPNKASHLVVAGMENKLTEPEVRNHILKLLTEREFEIRSKQPKDDPLKNVWRQKGIKDPPENIVNWLGKEASSMEELGQISFNNKEAAYNRFRNTNYLPQAVMALTRDDSKAEVFEKLIEQNHDDDIRYLKIIYQLNPELPYLFQGTLQTSIKGVFDEAQKTADNFWMADEMFRKGHLQIWLEETDAVTTLKLKDVTPTTPNFLHFLYQVDEKYPFYLNQKRADTPEDLADILRKDTSLWPLTTNYIRNHYVSTWFEGINQKNLNGRYNRLYEPNLNANWYNDQDRNMAAVDALIRSIDQKSVTPKIVFDQKYIQLTNIEGSKNIQYGFTVALQTPGYVNVALQTVNAPDGVTLSAHNFTFLTYNNQGFGDVKINLDVFKLIKDKIYQFKIIAKTPYETIELPVQLKVVFPTSSVIKRLAIYGLFAGAIWIFPFLLFSSFDRKINLVLSIGILLLFGKIMEVAMKKELTGYNAPTLNLTSFRMLLVLAYIAGPSYYFSSYYSQPYGFFFIYWMFAGAAVGMHVACKKFNLNKWLPLIPLGVDIVLALLTNNHLF